MALLTHPRRCGQRRRPEADTTRGAPAPRGRPRLGFSAFVILVVGCALGFPLAVAPGQAEPVSEYQVKAAFLYNFAKFVDWPPQAFRDAGAPIAVCILGDDPFGAVLEETVQDKTINGRELVIHRGNQVQQLKGCQILFVSSSEQKRLPEILASLRDTDVLTVGESDHFAELGGMIGFLLENNRVRFEINLDAAQHARLKLSAKLLAVARVVREKAN